MGALFLSPIYIALNIYIFMRSIHWFRACHGVFHKRWFIVLFAIVYAFFALSLLTSFLMPAGHVRRILKVVSNYWLGTLLYILLFILVADIIKFVLWHVKLLPQSIYESQRVFVFMGGVIAAIVIVISIYGTINARIIRTKNYDITINKACKAKELNIVFVADLHLGYSIGTAMMDNMVTKINAMKPDIVLIGGDFFDNEYEALDNPDKLQKQLRSIKSKYGVYACFGNHDIQEKILAGFTFEGKNVRLNDDRMIKFVENSNITLLQDNIKLIDDSFYLVVRRDSEKQGNKSGTRLTSEEMTADLNKTKPIIMLAHQPDELQEVADSGVDLNLNGHTHDGQMFPANLTVRFFWENPYGYLRKDNMQNIVTSGIGVFGPNMRTFTASEIVHINVKFSN